MGIRDSDVVLHTACSLELFINPYAPILKIEVIFGKPAELGDAQSRIEEDVECLIVAGEMIIVLHELKKPALICRRQGFSGDRIIDLSLIHIFKAQPMARKSSMMMTCSPGLRKRLATMTL